jgi:3-phenylpropionate/trans-cinnamate dioxygenase ferredoxin reductase component
MNEYDYLIIGGGMTADAAVQGIRELDVSGRIGIIGQEEHPPYDRPPLTKGLWYGKSLESIWRKTDQESVVLYLGRSATQIHVDKKSVLDDQGNEYRYQKLLLATGGIPKKLGSPDEGVIYFRTLNDYYQLKELYNQKNDFLIIGAGFIGTELASALAMNGKNVTLIFKDSQIGSKLFPKKFAAFLSAYFTEKEVQLVPNDSVVAVTKENDKFRVTTAKGGVFIVDGVIAGIGIEPNIKLAESIHLSIDNGITVDQYLQTSLSDIWAAGDVANFYSPHLESRVRIEHEDTANSMGKLAGRNMAGAKESYTYLPYFYSDLFEIGYEAIGELSADMETLEEWQELYRQGVIYYLREGKLRGALFVNIWDQIPKAREIIASKEPFSIKANAIFYRS